MLTLQNETNAPEGRFRLLGDKGRYKVTRGKTKDDFLSGFE
jgi:hypothetical protein